METLTRYLTMILPMLELRKTIHRAVLVGAFVVLFILVFTPFDYHLFSFSEQLLLALAVAALVIFSEITLSGVFRWIVRYREITPRVWHHLLLSATVVVICSQLIYLYTILLDLNNFHLAGVLIYLACTSAIASIPIAVVMLLRLQGLKTAERTIKLTTGTATAFLPVKQIVLASAYDNYVKLFSIENGIGPARILARLPLYKVEKELGSDLKFFRCHRSFIINLTMVERIEGGVSNCTVYLKGYPHPVPVARSRVRELQKLLTP